jgi:hypothetical protein
MLREFWFPLFLTLSGIAAGVVGGFMDSGNGRRVVWTFAAVFMFLGVLSYIWGDPVRGPFAKLLDPKSSDTFSTHMGVTMIWPISNLKEGIDLSRMVRVPGNPIVGTVSRTWWAGTKYTISIKSTNETVAVQLTNSQIQVLPPGWDANADDYSVEVIDETGKVRFQLIQATDYDVYLNLVLGDSQGKRAIVCKGLTLQFKPFASLTDADYPTRLFKYPSYANRGLRQ